ncbi:NUDIX domain-containing protein [Longimicrobium sp.]|uniref:NUDIX domain-containing protein n=1 Tax=Longimicrobium sp. TaxID=2029185 RepID=UPI002C3428EE|nr:NUDIX domain-containing protein [Longimicrobium sp.]HSU15591.1 NUDIX domain-containing protein [Longimicrobium sp.]
MAISPYLRALRERVGTMRLVLPSVTAAVRGDAGGLLLVRQRDGGVWSTPGGSIEPDETPADAVVREVWEETGLLVTPRRLLAVWGGPGFEVRYPNGDVAQYVTAVFECAVVSGSLRADGDETLEARFWRADEAAALPLADWLRPVLPRLYAPGEQAMFDAPEWHPPAGREGVR